MYVNSHGITLTSVTLVWVDKSDFVGNTAGKDLYLDVNPNAAQARTMDGGAWTLDGGVNIFSNNRFTNNNAYGNGGAISYKYYCFTGLAWVFAACGKGSAVLYVMLCKTANVSRLHCTLHQHITTRQSRAGHRRDGTAQHSTARHGMAWHGMTTTQRCTSLHEQT